MKFLLMCGGVYEKWETPKHLQEIAGEKLVERTIRLLRENGITDIAISSNDDRFDHFGVPRLTHCNSYVVTKNEGQKGLWCDGFYPMNKPVCYIFGDVFFSPEAIKTIVETETEDVEFFASAPPFTENYIKPWAEPYALKVVNNERLEAAKHITKVLNEKGMFAREPIMWELWQILKNTPLNIIDYTNYTVINDYTCDVDDKEDIWKLNKIIERLNNV